MRYISAIFASVIFVIFSKSGYCDWQEMMQVNTDNSGLQAPRDSDCP